MDHTRGGPVDDDTIIDNSAPVRLFNDVYWSRTTPPTTHNSRWAPFPRLPTELRLHIWLLFLRQHRMIELQLYVDVDEDGQSRRYTDCNGLGRVVSGRDYTVEIGGRAYAASLSPLLWVNREARQATLSFYRVHLPFPRYDGGRVLYLNPEYDVVCIGPRAQGFSLAPVPTERIHRLNPLPDFLHDVRAHDPRDQGVLHLAMKSKDIALFNTERGIYQPPFLPTDLHPAAAKSFTDILRYRLRSVLCIVGFRTRVRGIGEPPPGYPFHFAQTFPLRRRGRPVGGLRWFDTDPRWGVEFDLKHVPLRGDPRPYARAWEELEQAFGVSDRLRDFHFYICPTMKWPTHFMFLKPSESSSPIEEGSREELAWHLQEEQVQWRKYREELHQNLWSKLPGFEDQPMMPRHGPLVDAETFARMESAPSTAIGMWLFPPEAFKEPTRVVQSVFDLSAVRPGLFLFEV
ncbi:hypothetical protein C8A03DRAFT_19469 [Achaetomium macrosporum]|uniref:2EXR domain-containing protein n=1 Tax=Achaetomium macrosporum TaxID=79813 RepID=A0AAN7H6W8_9PEZI|nr:hypothetical protein C8A03DRAFT_19469 [Achaetomium macrosporum]